MYGRYVPNARNKKIGDTEKTPHQQPNQHTSFCIFKVSEWAFHTKIGDNVTLYGCGDTCAMTPSLREHHVHLFHIVFYV